MNATAIIANHPLGMPGGMVPLQGMRGGAAFDNLFSAFESTTPGVNITSAPVTLATAASKQIAEAMIRTMLGAPAAAPVEIVKVQSARVPQKTESDERTASRNREPEVSGPQENLQSASLNQQPNTQPDSGVSRRSSAGDTLLRSMLGLENTPVPAPPVGGPASSSIQSKTSNGPLEPEQPQEAALPPALAPDTASDITRETAPAAVSFKSDLAAVPIGPQGSMKKAQNATRTLAAAAPAPARLETVPTAAIQATIPNAEASAVEIPNAMRTEIVRLSRSTDSPEADARQQPGDVEAVERAAEPAEDSSMPAPLAFSAELTQITEPAAAPATNSTVVAAAADVAQVSTPAAQTAGAQANSVDTAAVGGNEKAGTLAPEQRDSGNAGGGGERPQERDTSGGFTPAGLKSDTPARAAAQAAAGAGDSSSGWTTNTASVSADSGTGTPAAAVRTSPAVDPATQPAATNPLAVTNTVQNPTVQEIAVRISLPDSPAVDLHVTERAGEIHVAVRTADVELQTTLRQDLGSLTSSLERAGYHAETFVPRAAAGSPMNQREDRQGSQPGFSGRGGSNGEAGNGKQKGSREQRGRSWLEQQEQSK